MYKHINTKNKNYRVYYPNLRHRPVLSSKKKKNCSSLQNPSYMKIDALFEKICRSKSAKFSKIAWTTNTGGCAALFLWIKNLRMNIKQRKGRKDETLEETKADVTCNSELQTLHQLHDGRRNIPHCWKAPHGDFAVDTHCYSIASTAPHDICHPLPGQSSNSLLSNHHPC